MSRSHPMPRPAAVWLAACALAGGARTQVAAPSPAAATPSALHGEVRVELASARQVWVREALHVSLRISIERAFWTEHLLQIFQRPLDLPLQVHVDGFLGSSEARASARVLEDASGPTLALGESIRRARRLPDVEFEGRPWAVFELVSVIVPTRPQTLAIGPARAEFAWSERFEESLARGRVPVRRVEGSVASGALEIEVRALPEEGRPVDFGGAVGRFEVQAEAQPRNVRVGDGVRVTLTVHGDDDALEFAAPRPDFGAAFRLQGQLEERAPRTRAIHYDLVARQPTEEPLPPLRLATFDPRQGRYEILATEALAVSVRAATNDSAGSPPARESGSRNDAREVQPPVPPSRPAASQGEPRWRWGAVALMAVGVLALWRAGRRRKDAASG